MMRNAKFHLISMILNTLEKDIERLLGDSEKMLTRSVVCGIKSTRLIFKIIIEANYRYECLFCKITHYVDAKITKMLVRHLYRHEKCTFYFDS